MGKKWRTTELFLNLTMLAGGGVGLLEVGEIRIVAGIIGGICAVAQYRVIHSLAEAEKEDARTTKTRPGTPEARLKEPLPSVDELKESVAIAQRTLNDLMGKKKAARKAETVAMLSGMHAKLGEFRNALDVKVEKRKRTEIVAELAELVTRMSEFEASLQKKKKK